MASCGFPKTRRLVRKKQFERVFAQSHKVKVQNLTVLACPNDYSHPRLGLIISKRSTKTAVARNRIKRLTRETFRQLQHRLGRIDLIVMSHPKLAELDNANLNSLLAKCLIDAADRCKNF